MTTTIKHGTPSAYSNGCTCGPCREAGRVRRTEGSMAAFLAGKTRKPPLFAPEDRTTAFDPADTRHGTPSAYTAGCRCPWCRDAGVAARQAKKLNIRLPKGYNAQHPDTW